MGNFIGDEEKILTVHQTHSNNSSSLLKHLQNWTTMTTQVPPDPNNDDGQFHFEGRSLIVIVLFVIIQASIWGFFIFCYFAKKKHSDIQRNISITLPPQLRGVNNSVYSNDLPPNYNASVNPTNYPPFVEIMIDEQPPDYEKAVTAASKPPSR